MERIGREVERQLRSYMKLWRRAQAMPLDDPFVPGICRAWEQIAGLAKTPTR